jgi:hypothetical protein
MHSKSIYTAAVVIVLALSTPALAGPGGGGGGGMGGPRYQMGGGAPRGPATAPENRSDKALQQDRDREMYRGPDATRDTQKSKAKGLGDGSGQGDQVRSQDRVTDQERLQGSD